MAAITATDELYSTPSISKECVMENIEETDYLKAFLL
jgi:hypothetical protein